MIMYDYQDADGFERGFNGPDRPKAKRIYKLKHIDHENNLAHLESWSAWGKCYDDVFPLHTVEPIPEPIER